MIIKALKLTMYVKYVKSKIKNIFMRLLTKSITYNQRRDILKYV